MSGAAVPGGGPESSRAVSKADESWIGATASGVLESARSFRDTTRFLLNQPRSLQQRAQQRYRKLHERTVSEQLRAMPLPKLREVSPGLRVSDLENAGLRSVLHITSSSPEELQRYPGVGPKTAEQAVGAAWRIAENVRNQAVVRFGSDGTNPVQTQLLGDLRALEHAEQVVAELRSDIEALTTETDELSRRARRSRSRTRMFLSRKAKKVDALDALDELNTLLAGTRVQNTRATAEEVRSSSQPQDPDHLWRDYRQRAAVYNTLLERVTGTDAPAERAGHGIPREMEREATKISLDTSLLRASLRGYQAFGAQFALSRGRCLLGDEMGLGKTIEALAAMAHLAAGGERYFVVVCPASVLVNWVEEVGRHSGLVPHRLHGAQRDESVRTWIRDGGVAVTTYDTLRRLTHLEEVPISVLVADEAHYVKNPGAKRSRSINEIAQRARHVLFLTGTPMENRVEEFKNLVSHLQPEVAANIRAEDALMRAGDFRRAVAPVYLRRNQRDVLAELPEKLELDDWVELGGADGDAYRQAVAAKDFMAMRRAPYRPGTATGSAKLDRLADIVQESADNGWKVVVFSYFLDVVESVRACVGAAAVPPLTGKLSPGDKQALVDDFNRRDGHAVLVGQITAGGSGLNLQGASVVVLAEPQLKPTSEEQAIARCYRMGQSRKVHVHRLMAKDTVDQRLQEILQGKSRLFDDYARESAAKRSDAAATDATTINRGLLHDTTVPLDKRILQVERQRLGVD